MIPHVVCIQLMKAAWVWIYSTWRNKKGTLVAYFLKLYIDLAGSWYRAKNRQLNSKTSLILSTLDHYLIVITRSSTMRKTDNNFLLMSALTMERHVPIYREHIAIPVHVLYVGRLYTSGCDDMKQKSNALLGDTLLTSAERKPVTSRFCCSAQNVNIRAGRRRRAFRISLLFPCAH